MPRATLNGAEDAAWYHPEPNEAAGYIRDHGGFCGNGIQIGPHNGQSPFPPRGAAGRGDPR